MDNINSTQPIECNQEPMSLDDLAKIMEETINKNNKPREELKTEILKTGRDNALILVEIIDEIDPSVIIQYQVKKFDEQLREGMKKNLTDMIGELKVQKGEHVQNNYLGVERMFRGGEWINL